MYDAAPAAVEAFWRSLAPALRSEGVEGVPASPAWPVELDAHWRDPALLLSQACGYPLVTRLRGKVQVVGAFRYAVPGCRGIDYRSELVVRHDDPARSLGDLCDRVVATNDPASQSGFNALKTMLAPLAREGRFFGKWVVTGTHRRSLAYVREGRADLAAIDCVTLAGLRRHRPELVEGLRVLASTPPAPGLPLVTSLATPPDELAALRRALAAACDDPAAAPAREALFIDGFEPVDASVWEVIDRSRAPLHVEARPSDAEPAVASSRPEP